MLNLLVWIPVCTQLSRGIFAILGVVSADSFSTIHSYTNTYHMPFFSPWFPEKVTWIFSQLDYFNDLNIFITWILQRKIWNEEKNQLNSLLWQVPVPTSGLMDYALSLRPEYHQAILDVITYYGWKNIIYIYDSHDGKFHPFSRISTIVWSAWDGIAVSDYLLKIRRCELVCKVGKRKKGKSRRAPAEGEPSNIIFHESPVSISLLVQSLWSFPFFYFLFVCLKEKHWLLPATALTFVSRFSIINRKTEPSRWGAAQEKREIRFSSWDKDTGASRRRTP